MMNKTSTQHSTMIASELNHTFTPSAPSTTGLAPKNTKESRQHLCGKSRSSFLKRQASYHGGDNACFEKLAGPASSSGVPGTLDDPLKHTNEQRGCMFHSYSWKDYSVSDRPHCTGRDIGNSSSVVPPAVVSEEEDVAGVVLQSPVNSQDDAFFVTEEEEDDDDSSNDMDWSESNDLLVFSDDDQDCFKWEGEADSSFSFDSMSPVKRPGTPLGTNKGPRVHFSPDLVSSVVEIPSHRAYTNEEKLHIWTSLRTLKANAYRNTVEFAYEGKDYKSVLEEDRFLVDKSGKTHHPAWVRYRPELYETQQGKGQNSFSAAS